MNQKAPSIVIRQPLTSAMSVDREALALYRIKRYEWLSWYELRKGDPNTIQQQLFSMMFLDLAYRPLAVARRDWL
jgi:hypothetical protein